MTVYQEKIAQKSNNNLQNRLSFYLSMTFLLTLLIFTRWDDAFTLPKESVMIFSGGIISYYLLFKFLKKDLSLNLVLPFFWPAFLFGLWMFLSSFFSPSGLNIRALSFLFLLLFYMFLSAGTFQTRKQFDIFNIFNLTGIFIISLLATGDYYGLSPFQFRLSRFGTEPTKTIFSTLGNPNFLGAFTAMVLPVFLYGTFSEKSMHMRYFFLSGTTVTIFICALAFSRSGWLALLVGLFSFFLLSWHSPAAREKIILSRGISLMLFFAFLISTIIFLTKNPLNRGTVLVHGATTAFERVASDSGSLNKRLLAWQVALKMVEENPLAGVGRGNFRKAYLETQAKFLEQKEEYIPFLDKFAHPHNEFLSVLAEGGIPGFVLFLFLLLSIFIQLIKNHFSTLSSDADLHLLSSALFASLIATLVDSMLSFPLTRPAEGLFAALLVGISAGPLFEKNASPALSEQLPGFLFKITASRISGPVISFAIILFSSIVFLFLIPHSLIALANDRLTGTGRALIETSKPELARQYLEKALALSTDNQRTLYLLALAILLGNKKSPEDLSKAEFLLKKASLLEKDPVINFNLACLYEEQGKIENAIEQYNEALRLNPLFPEARLGLALKLFTKGEIKKGALELRRLGKYRDAVKINGELHREDLSSMLEEGTMAYLKALEKSGIRRGVKVSGAETEFTYLDICANEVSLSIEIPGVNTTGSASELLVVPLLEHPDFPGVFRVTLPLDKGCYRYTFNTDSEEGLPDPEGKIMEDPVSKKRYSIIEI